MPRLLWQIRAKTISETILFEAFMSMDWYPRSRDGQIHMVQGWLPAFAVKAALWGVPQDIIASVTEALTAAQEKFAVVKSGERAAGSHEHPSETGGQLCAGKSGCPCSPHDFG
ncbi:MAG: hypothetical protein LBG43_00250 [Treponema sp.]|nr:hypothetical protein [Treponema sp.]